MKRFLIAGGLDGRSEALATLRSLVQQRRPDGVLFAGEVLGDRTTSHADKLKGWNDAFEGLGNLGVFTAMVPGAGMAPLREFARLAIDNELELPNLHVVHATLFESGNLALCGVGGELTEFEDRIEDRLCYSRASAEYFLRPFQWSDMPRKFLLLTVAPPGPLGGDTGNRICGDFIDSYHPTLCVVAGPTERRGSQRIASTLVVNPGRLADGSAAWLDTTRSADQAVEFIGP
jgi:hypothetical protein